MVSEVGIINRALTKLGGEPILSRTDASKRARTANRHYDDTRDLALAAHPWNFALRRAVIGASATPPAWGYANAFPLPVDCLRLVGIDGLDAYQVEGRSILADADGPLRLRYIARVTDTAQFAPAFVDSFATLLAAEIAYDLTGSRTLSESLRTAFERGLPGARNVDAQESPGAPVADEGSWLGVRN